MGRGSVAPSPDHGGQSSISFDAFDHSFAGTNSITVKTTALLGDLEGQMRQAARTALCPDEDCIEMLFGCIRGFTEIEGPSSLNVATSFYWLGVAFERMSDVPEAERCFQQCLEARRQALHPYHPDLDSIYTALANLYYYSTELIKADELFSKALDIRIVNDGPEHPRVAAVCYLLAHINMHSNQFERALDHFNQVVTIHVARLEAGYDDCSDIGQTYENMADLSKKLGRLADALLYYEHAKDAYEKQPDSQHTANAERIRRLILDLDPIDATQEPSGSFYGLSNWNEAADARLNSCSRSSSSSVDSRCMQHLNAEEEEEDGANNIGRVHGDNGNDSNSSSSNGHKIVARPSHLRPASSVN